MVKCWKTCQMAILKIGWAKYSQFSNIFLSIPLAKPPAAPPGRCRPQGRGYFSQFVWKMIIFGSSYFQNRHWASFSKFHHLAGYASYHPTCETISYTDVQPENPIIVVATSTISMHQRHSIIPQTDLSVRVLTVLLRVHGCSHAPLTLLASI